MRRQEWLHAQLGGSLAMDAIRLCHAQTESLVKQRPVRIPVR